MKRTIEQGRCVWAARALGFHVLMGGLVLLALMHPLFYVVLAYHAGVR